jgi:signal peptidase I
VAVDAPERSGPGAQPPARRRRSKRKSLPWWQEMLVLLGTALVLAVVVKTFFVQAFYIPSGSMEPTLNVNDRILVQKVSYWNGDVHRGDIVVFDDPGGWLGQEAQVQPHNTVQRALELFGLFPTGGHLVKRVIGVEGDHVRCCDRHGDIVVNGVPLDESYLPKRVHPSDSDFDVTVPEDHLWVMGDNRGASSDSRAHTGAPGAGFVAVDDVVGKVWAIVWPGSRLRLVDRPEVFDDAALDGDTSR